MEKKERKNTFFKMTGLEYRFICGNAGLSRKNLAQYAPEILGKSIHQSTIAKWEKKLYVDGLHIHLLKHSMPEELFLQLRDEWPDEYRKKLVNWGNSPENVKQILKEYCGIDIEVTDEEK